MKKKSWTGAVLAASAFVAYVTFYWRNLFLKSLVPYDGDIPMFFYPCWAVGKHLLQDGWFLLWDPYRNMGQPFLAALQNQALYPIRFLCVFFNYAHFQQLYVLAHVLLAGIGGVLLIRKWTSDRATWALSALGFGFNGFFYWRVLYTSDFSSLAWAPLILAALAWNKPRCFGITLFFQILAGFPPFTILTLIAAVALALASDDRKQAFRTGAWGLVLGLGLSAIVAVPFLEMFRESNRPLLLSTEMASEKSLAPLLLIKSFLTPSWVLPFFEPFHTSLRSFYFGSVLLGLGIHAFKVLNARQRILGLFVIGSAVLSMGSFFPLYKFIPGITLFRYPLQFLALTSLTLVVFSALAFQTIKSTKLRWLLVGIMALELAFYTSQASFGWADQDFIDSSVQQFPPIAQPSSHRIFHTMFITDRTQDWELRDPNVRRFAQGLLTPSLAAALGHREVISHNNLTSGRILAYAGRLNYASPNSNLFKFADVDRIVALTEAGVKKETPSEEDVGVIPVKPLGRAFFIGENGHVDDVLEDKPGYFETKVTGPGRLVFSESFYPGWSAKLDGHTTLLTPFENTFLSIGVGAGSHDVAFSYRPRSFFIGSAIFLITVLFMSFKGVQKVSSKFSSQNQ